MFDSSNITSAEKQIKNLALFYGFQRQNLITTAENMLTARGIKRLARAARTVNNLNQAFTSKETAEYSPSYAQTRVILDSIDFDPEENRRMREEAPPEAIEQQQEVQEARQEIQQRRALEPTRAQRTRDEMPEK